MIQIAPPLICDAPLLDDLVGRLGDVLERSPITWGSRRMTVPSSPARERDDARSGTGSTAPTVTRPSAAGRLRPRDRVVQRRVAFADAELTSIAPFARRAPPSGAGADVSLARRTAIMFRFRELLAAHADELAAFVTSEHGKTLEDAAGEVQRGLEVVEFACGLAHLLKGEASEQIATDVDSMSYRQPLGVAVGITPFNFPSMVPMWMFPISLACGNTFVLKPSERDPSASLLLAELLAEAGLPPGRLLSRPGRPRGGRRAARASRRRRGLVRRLDADRPARPPDRVRARQARAGAGRREEPRDRDARRRPRRGRRRARVRGVRQRRPAVHGDQRRGRGRPRGAATRSSTRVAERGARAAHRPGR